METRTFTLYALKGVLKEINRGIDAVGVTTTVFQGLNITGRCNYPHIAKSQIHKLPDNIRLQFRNVLNQYAKGLISDSLAYHKICDLILENCKSRHAAKQPDFDCKNATLRR